MEDSRFDALSRALARTPTRRGEEAQEKEAQEEAACAGNL
jgi:hypothetical protein